MMNKINTEHLSRHAFVYVRQSTLDQVHHNHESRLRQYGLADRALGWPDVTVIDDDLGRSGSGTHRPGFERLLVALCGGEVGAVFCIEASRLARNGRDWHTLLEFCRLVGCLLIDEDGIYDPRQPNDRLLLGMKGTLSEMELSTFRQRSQAALDQKARRGELFTSVPIGYVRVTGNRIEKDPEPNDRKQFRRDSARHDVAAPIAAASKRKRLFAKAQRIGKEVGMSRACALAGLHRTGTRHRALDDALNVAHLLPWVWGHCTLTANQG
jgi:DNA invertase Pin-like site-specific DNA recombinase